MKDFKTVFNFELKTQLTKKAAIVATAVIMAVMLALTFLPRIIDFFSNLSPKKDASALTGYVFEGPETTALLAPLTGEKPTLFTSREELVKAVENKDVEVGFVVKPDLSYEAIYLDRGMMDTRDLTFAEALSGIKKSQRMLDYGLTPQDFVDIESTKAEGVTTVLGQNSMNAYWISYLLMIMAYMMIVMYGNQVSSIIAREKDSRTMEILITSTKPASLILGKVAAAGVSALAQFGMIILATVIGFLINKATYPPELLLMVSGTLTPAYLWSFIFFTTTGFVLYLFLYAALGSTVSKMEDLGSATGVIQFFFSFAYMLAILAAQMPASLVSTIGSIVPFTSLMIMPLRTGMVSVPFYQYLISGALMLAFVAFFAFLSIKIYRWGSLNYGNKTKLRKIVKEALRSEH